jgi:DNA repair exonuclease SbcCD ATPase subunit
MIVFKKVRYKNFLSTGQQFIEIDLDKAPTTLVVGDNGSGKSIEHLIIFFIYNN